MKYLTYCLIIVLLALVAWPKHLSALDLPLAEPHFTRSQLIIQTATGSHPIDIELAETPQQQQYGLMHRTELQDNQGMLFLASSPRDMLMWMKNTPLPLDMLFIDSSGRIVYIAKNTTPDSPTVISSGQPVRAVLELAGGVSEKLDIKVGDRIDHPYFKP